MDQQERTQQPWDDPGLLAPLPILQQTSSDCGVACLAMAANVTYASALYVFDGLGLKQNEKDVPFTAVIFVISETPCVFCIVQVD